MKIILDPVRHIGELLVKEARGFKEECEKLDMTGEHVLDDFWIENVLVQVRMHVKRGKES